ncbi:MAG: GNAT family N-acetyltransferase [Frankiaceae bacterium]|nr:GNAT family N-acetyltransferase [Frankiaceae bacterium]
MTFEIQHLTAADVVPAMDALEQAFGGVAHPADTDVEASVVDPTRFYAARDGERIVGTAGSFAFSMTVPGGPVPVAGVTWVGVLPTHRRQGVLGSLMSRQLVDLHEEGSAVAALWASEAAIYGRYGYGTAAWLLSLALPRGAAFRTPVPTGRLSLEEPGAQVRETYARVAARTAGWTHRDDAWWGFRLHDPEHRRDGASLLQCVVTDGGYALYATTVRWVDGVPSGEVGVREVVAETTAARARLWRYLLDLDLMGTVRVAVATDDPLLTDLLAEPRVARASLRDCLHVRLVDVSAALVLRRYAADIDVVLAVTDRHCPWNEGSWRLEGGRGGATCTRTEQTPDLELDVADLGAAYLGGTPLRSRPVHERASGALGRASTAFGALEGAPWHPQVW